MYHGGDVYGAYMLIHGGINGEENEVLRDFRLFDLGM
jgi:hypothetical protein